MGGAAPAGGGGKRSLDFELNLVPFIDLLSCCIAFLLITAAWNQLSRIEANQKADPPGASRPDQERKDVQLMVRADGYVVLFPGTTTEDKIPRVGEYDIKTLSKKLRRFKDQYPGIQKVKLAAVDPSAYKELVRVMDLLVNIGLSDITLGGVPEENP